MRGAAAQRIVRTIRKPRNKADEAIAPKPGWDGAFRAICFVARLANSACYWLRLASRISSRKASVATTRGLFRGSLVSFPTKESFGEKGYDVQNRVILDSLTSGNVVSSSQLDAAGPDLALGIPVDDLADGRMVAGHVGKEGVLLARRGNEYFAIGAVCSHYSGPLAEGI